MRVKAQSMLEYAILVVIVSAALIAMSKYMHRAMNARLKQVQLELNERSRGQQIDYVEQNPEEEELAQGQVERQVDGDEVQSQREAESYNQSWGGSESEESLNSY